MDYILDIGEGCYFHPSAVLNAPIFRLEFVEGKSYRRQMPHFARTFIGNDVHVFANTSIEGGWKEGTIIKDHVWIDNNCLIGHDVVLHERVCIAGMSIVAGVVEIGRDSFLGVGCTIRPEITIGERCYIGAGCTVYKDVPDGMVVRTDSKMVMRPNPHYPPNSSDIYPQVTEN